MVGLTASLTPIGASGLSGFLVCPPLLRTLFRYLSYFSLRPLNGLLTRKRPVMYDMLTDLAKLSSASGLTTTRRTYCLTHNTLLAPHEGVEPSAFGFGDRCSAS